MTGLFATFVSVVLSFAAFFEHPDGLFSLAAPDILRISVFLIIGIIFSVMSESRLKALEREAEQHRRLLEEQDRRAAALTWPPSEREQLQRVADHVPVILASVGPDRRFKFVNQANADRFGVTPADMVGRRIDEFLSPALTAEIEPYITRVLAGERVEYQTTYSFPLTGHQRMQGTYVPERAADGRVVGWIAALVNVTPMRQVEADVKNFAFLIENTSDFIAMSDLGFRPIYANAAAAQIAGKPAVGARRRNRCSTSSALRTARRSNASCSRARCARDTPKPRSGSGTSRRRTRCGSPATSSCCAIHTAARRATR